MTVPVTIVASEPCAVYQGVVYDRDVTLELPAGTRFGAFDPDATVSEAFVGQTREVTLQLLVNADGVVVGTGQSPGVEPEPEEPLGWNGHNFRGRVADLGTGEDMFDATVYGVLLDVGPGTVSFTVPEERWTDLAVEQSLSVTATRTDVSVDAE